MVFLWTTWAQRQSVRTCKSQREVIFWDIIIICHESCHLISQTWVRKECLHVGVSCLFCGSLLLGVWPMLQPHSSVFAIFRSSGCDIFPLRESWQTFSVISVRICLCIFSSNRCRFAKVNVNCLFTVSRLVQFTRTSFPIQSSAAVGLSFTPLIG